MGRKNDPNKPYRMANLFSCDLETTDLEKNNCFSGLFENLKSGHFSGRSWFLERWSIWRPIRTPIASVLIQVPGLRCRGVHANRKYPYTGLFHQNNPFNRNLNLHFSGLWLISVFAPLFYPKKREKWQPEAHQCPPKRSPRRIGGGAVLWAEHSRRYHRL